MSKMRKTTYRMLMVVLAMSLVFGLLAGCIGKKNTGDEDEQQRVLRIALMSGSRDYDDGIRTQYTDLFKFNNMNIDIEFMYAYDWSMNQYQPYDPNQEQPDMLEEMKNLMQGPNPPDIVFLQSTTELAALIEDNLLTPLDSLIATDADNFDISDFVPSVIDGLRNVGNEELYALAPTFTSQALIYNKAIFDQQNVEYPQDGMYWDDVFDLARRVTSGEDENRIAGFSFNTGYWTDLYYGMREAYLPPLELSIFNDDKDALVVDNAAWEDVWNEMYRLNELDIMPTEHPNMYNYDGGGGYNPYRYDAFLSGNLAMAVVNYYFINDIVRANRDADLIEGFDYIDWDVVTMPVHPQHPDVGGMVYMDPIMGINAKAQNPEDAWRFIKFMNSEAWADLKSMSTTSMVSRASYIKPRDNAQFNIEAFYSLLPAPVNTDTIYYAGRNSEIYWAMERIGQEKFMSVLNGDISVKQGLQQWQTEGNTLLQLIKDNPDKNIWEIENEFRWGENSWGGEVMPFPIMEDIEWETSDEFIDDIIWETEDGNVNDAVDLDTIESIDE